MHTNDHPYLLWHESTTVSVCRALASFHHTTLSQACDSPFAISEPLLAPLPEVDRVVVRQVIQHNLARGRAHRVMARIQRQPLNALENAGFVAVDPAATEAEQLWHLYQCRVQEVYRQEKMRIWALSDDDCEVWSGLRQQMLTGAFHVLLHHGQSAEYAWDKAAEAAQQACEHIFAYGFPCDVSFDLWAYTIVKNIVLCTLTRSHDLMDRQSGIVSLELLEDQGFIQPDLSPAHQPAAAISDDVQSIINAIDKLHSHERRTVIVYTYFFGLSDLEIADKMGRSKAVVQTLRHRALRQLRDLVEEP